MPAPKGLERTLRLLTKTPNQAAIEVLDAGLRSDEPVVRTSAARALCFRPGASAARALLMALPETPADVHAAVASRDCAQRLRSGVIAALNGDDLLLAKRACRYTHDACDPHVLPTLIEQAARPDHPYGLGMATTALQLARSLTELIHDGPQAVGAPDGERPEDPAFSRRAALNALVRAVDTFAAHGHVELVEAFLLLVVPEDLVLRRLLNDPTHAAHQPALEGLQSCTAANAMHVVSNTLLQEHPPAPLVGVLTSRVDKPFVTYLLQEQGERPPLRALEFARGLAGFAWAEEPHEPLLLELPGRLQANAVRLAAATSMSKRRLTNLCESLLKSGQREGKVAACQAAGGLKSHVASTLISQALTDGDPSVVAAATTQLRNRGVEGSTEKLVELLDHGHQSVKQAAQSGLPELNFRAFCDAFDHLEESAKQTRGRLVGKADPNCVAQVTADLGAASPNHRLRTLEVAAALGLPDDLSDALLPHLEDADPAVRQAAARALRGAKGEPARRALTALLKDSSPTVREAAEAALGPIVPIDVASGLVQDLQQEFPT